MVILSYYCYYFLSLLMIDLLGNGGWWFNLLLSTPVYNNLKGHSNTSIDWAHFLSALLASLHLILTICMVHKHGVCILLLFHFTGNQLRLLPRHRASDPEAGFRPHPPLLPALSSASVGDGFSFSGFSKSMNYLGNGDCVDLIIPHSYIVFICQMSSFLSFSVFFWT